MSLKYTTLQKIIFDCFSHAYIIRLLLPNTNCLILLNLNNQVVKKSGYTIIDKCSFITFFCLYGQSKGFVNLIAYFAISTKSMPT